MDSKKRTAQKVKGVIIQVLYGLRNKRIKNFERLFDEHKPFKHWFLYSQNDKSQNLKAEISQSRNASQMKLTVRK